MKIGYYGPWQALAAFSCFVNGKILCFLTLAHFYEHNQLFEALGSTHFSTFITIQPLNCSKWPKMTPLEPPTTPTKPPILGQQVKIFQFCKKGVKVH